MDEYANLMETMDGCIVDTDVRNIVGNTGPTGPTGYNERYLSITSQRINKSSLITYDSLTITIEKYLSYYPGDNINGIRRFFCFEISPGKIEIHLRIIFWDCFCLPQILCL
jgi:hypothetical protein